MPWPSQRIGALLLAMLVSASAACELPPRAAIDAVSSAPAADAGASGADAGCAGGSIGGACARSQAILTCDVTNARDLGGVPLAPTGSVACGALLRGPPLANLSPSGCADVARFGIRTVIDLRSDGERLSAPDDTCVGARAVIAPLPVPYAVSAADYLADFDTDASIVAIFHALGDAANYPVYMHCSYGRDRTGVVSATVLLALGASRKDVLAEYALSAATVGAYPLSLEAVLDEIDRRGGIAATLAAKGVPASDLAVLRAHAAEP